MDQNPIRQPGERMEAGTTREQTKRPWITPKSHKNTNQLEFSKSNNCIAMVHQAPTDCRGVGGGIQNNQKLKGMDNDTDLTRAYEALCIIESQRIHQEKKSDKSVDWELVNLTAKTRSTKSFKQDTYMNREKIQIS